MLVVEQLRPYPLFAGLSDDELAALSAGIKKRFFAKGTYIFHTGAPGLNMYLIESGLVRIFFTNNQGDEFLVNLAYPTQCVGLPLLLDNQVRLVGVAAVRDTVTLSLSREVVFDAMRRIPQFALNIYLETVNMTRLLGEYAHGLVTLSVQGKLAKALLHFSDMQGNELDLPISQGDLAALVGSSRGHVNRALTNMRKQGLIRVEGEKIYILDREGLVKMGEV